MKISWLPRGRDWRTWHIYRCRACGRRFCDDEPGSWTRDLSDRFPELGEDHYCERRPRSVCHMDGCPASGPFCPACAPRVVYELLPWLRD